MDQDPRTRLFVELVQGLICRPAETVITTVVHSQGIVYELCVPDDEVGRVLGKGGRTINALRTLMTALWARDHKNVRINPPASRR